MWPNELSDSQQTWRRPSFPGWVNKKTFGNELWLRLIVCAESRPERRDRPVLACYSEQAVSLCWRDCPPSHQSLVKNCQANSRRKQSSARRSKPALGHPVLLWGLSLWPDVWRSVPGFISLTVCMTWPTAALAGENRNNNTLTCCLLFSMCLSLT